MRFPINYVLLRLRMDQGVNKTFGQRGLCVTYKEQINGTRRRLCTDRNTSDGAGPCCPSSHVHHHLIATLYFALIRIETDEPSTVSHPECISNRSREVVGHLFPSSLC